jgi:hypothetical protein
MLPAGWLLLLYLATARMWKLKIEHDLTSDLQVYKIIAYCILVVVCSSISYAFAVRLAAALSNQFLATVKLVFLLNLLVALDVMAIGILGIYGFDKFKP